MDKEKDRAIRRQAVALTESVFRKMSPPPTRSVEKVAPVVYALLIDEIDPKAIELALINARAHTADAIGYALRQVIPPTDKTAPPKYREIQPAPPWHPTDAEKAAAKAHLADMRAMLRGEKKIGPA